MRDERRCTATNGLGERCRKAAILGGAVCMVHGGSAPQVRAKARARLASMVDPALDALQKAMASKDMRAVVSAAQAVLNRAGYPAASRLEIDEVELRVTTAQVEGAARVIRRTFEVLGLPMDATVRRVLRAAITAEVGDDEWSPPEVRALPPHAEALFTAWWAGEDEVPPLELAAPPDDDDQEEATA